MTRFSDQRGPSREAVTFFAALATLFSGFWFAESIGGWTGSHLIAGVFGFATAIAIVGLSQIGSGSEVESSSDKPLSILHRFVAGIFAVGIFGYLAFEVVDRFARGLTYMDSTMFGFWAGCIIYAQIALWRSARQRKRQQST